jgi:hypothetical protein
LLLNYILDLTLFVLQAKTILNTNF